MKRVLIITYYWPPSGGAGVQRWMKMSKYLKEFGWEPVIYTAANAEYPIIDQSLEKDVPSWMEVIHHPIWEPYSLYKRFTGKKQSEKVYSGFLAENKPRSFAQKISIWIRGNFFIPDARCFWIKPSVKFLLKEIPKLNIDVIISTGTPHSMHLIADELKKKTGLPWLADFRDPWTNIDFYDHLMLTRAADAKHHRLEKMVLQNADEVVTVSPQWAADFEKVRGKKVHVITNGYDAEDFDILNDESIKNNGNAKFTISHIGLLTGERTLNYLWEALSELAASDPSFHDDLKIQLAGKIEYSVLEELNKAGLKPQTEYLQYVSHTEAVRLQCTADVLLLVQNNVPGVKGHIPGKLFEYLAARRPILLIGDENGDAAHIIQQTQSGVSYRFEEKEKIKSTVQSLYSQWKTGMLKVQSVGVEKYERWALAKKISEIISETYQRSE